jgi:hypothetical protein
VELGVHIRDTPDRSSQLPHCQTPHFAIKI